MTDGETTDTGAGDGASGHANLVPRLPGGIADIPAYPHRPPSAPLPPSAVFAPPSSTTSAPAAKSASALPPPTPVIALASTPGPVRTASVEHNFVPLRVDPPPRLVATWWLRYMMLLAMVVAIGAVVMTEYAIGPGGVAEARVVIAPHVLVAVLIVWWSALAMIDAGRLVPRTRYHRSSNGLLAAVLWLCAFAAPFVVVAVIARAEERFGGSADDLATPAISAVAVLLGLLVVWLPFGYLGGQAHRIGAPRGPFVLWFGATLLAGVGSLAIVLLGLEEMLAESGTTPAERTLQTAVLYGVPSFVFALSAWRATTVFDEVIDLRWHRWKGEWELTLKAMAAEPPPGPELPPGSDDWR